jgi:hypothetical protein
VFRTDWHAANANWPRNSRGASSIKVQWRPGRRRGRQQRCPQWTPQHRREPTGRQALHRLPMQQQQQHRPVWQLRLQSHSSRLLLCEQCWASSSVEVCLGSGQRFCLVLLHGLLGHDGACVDTGVVCTPSVIYLCQQLSLAAAPHAATAVFAVMFACVCDPHLLMS